MFINLYLNSVLVCILAPLSLSKLTTAHGSSSDNPYCFYYARSTSVGAFQTDSSLGCGQNTSDVLALATTTGGSGGHSTITSVSFGGGSIDQPLVASTGGAIGSSPVSRQ